MSAQWSGPTVLGCQEGRWSIWSWLPQVPHQLGDRVLGKQGKPPSTYQRAKSPSVCQAVKSDHCWSKQAGQADGCTGKLAFSQKDGLFGVVSHKHPNIWTEGGIVMHHPLALLLWREVPPHAAPLAHILLFLNISDCRLYVGSQVKERIVSVICK